MIRIISNPNNLSLLFIILAKILESLKLKQFDFVIIFNLQIPIVTYFEISDVFINTFLINLELSPISYYWRSLRYKAITLSFLNKIISKQVLFYIENHNKNIILFNMFKKQTTNLDIFWKKS